MNDIRTRDEVAELADRVETARGKLPLQSDPALFAELSEAEIAAERELAEWMRKQRRRQRRGSVSAELAAEKRDRRVALTLRRADDADARWHRRALAARRRVSNPDARLAQLYRRAEWSSRALIGVVVLGMLWAGVNVQHNLVPSGDIADPLYWLSYGFEAMISIPIITIMVVATTAARWGREIARGKVVFLEAALLGVTIALNAGPHLAAGELARAAEAAVAPVMVGVVIWLHAWVSARYAQLIDAIPGGQHEPALDEPAHTAEAIEIALAPAITTSHRTSLAPAALAPRTTPHLAPTNAAADANRAPAPTEQSLTDPEATLAPSAQEQPAPAGASPSADQAASASAPLEAELEPIAADAAAPDRTPADQDDYQATPHLAPASASPDATSATAHIETPAPAAAGTALALDTDASTPPHHGDLAPADTPQHPALAGARSHRPAPQTSSASTGASHASHTASASAVVRAMPAPRTDDGPDQYDALAQRIRDAGLCTKPTVEQISTVLRMLADGESHAAINRATAPGPYSGGIHHKTIKTIAAAAEQVKVPVRAVR